MKKEVRKFSKDSQYLYGMQSIYDEINNKLEKISFRISKGRSEIAYATWEKAKYLFPADIFVTLEGIFKNIEPSEVILIIEYFSYSQDELSGHEKYILDEIEKIAKEYKLNEIK